MHLITVSVSLVLAVAQAGAERALPEQTPAVHQDHSTSPGEVEGAFEDRPFVVRSAIAGEAKLGKAILGNLQPGEHNGAAVIILSEDPDECSLIHQQRAKKNARYVVMRIAEKVEGYPNLTTPPEGGGACEVGDANEVLHVFVSVTTRGPDCKVSVVKKAKSGTFRLTKLPGEPFAKKGDPRVYGGRFELVFDKGSKEKVKGRFYAQMCDALSEELEHPDKKPEVQCE